MDVPSTAIVLWGTATVAARTLGVLLFGAALLTKLRHRDEFAAIVARYLATPLPRARIAAMAVMVLEGATVILLMLPATAWAGGWLAALLLLVFAAAMAAALLRGERELDCGCGATALRQRVRWPLVVRNMVLAVAFMPLAVAPVTPATGMGALDGVAAGGLLFIMTLCFGTFVALDDSFAELKRRYG